MPQPTGDPETDRMLYEMYRRELLNMNVRTMSLLGSTLAAGAVIGVVLLAYILAG